MKITKKDIFLKSIYSFVIYEIKEKYVVHIKSLKQALNHGLKF